MSLDTLNIRQSNHLRKWHDKLNSSAYQLQKREAKYNLPKRRFSIIPKLSAEEEIYWRNERYRDTK